MISHTGARVLFAEQDQDDVRDVADRYIPNEESRASLCLWFAYLVYRDLHTGLDQQT